MCSRRRVRELSLSLAGRELGVDLDGRVVEVDRVRRDLSRRELLEAGAGLALTAGLAGCQINSGIQGSVADTKKSVAKKVDGDLVYFNWSEYVDPALLKEFEKRYGVKVRESNFDSLPAMMAKLRAGIEYDVIFPSGDYVERLIKGNQLLVIDRDKLKNIHSRLPAVRGALVRQRLGALRALHDVRDRARLPRGQGQGHDRVVGRPGGR